jgi:hypothetical protein
MKFKAALFVLFAMVALCAACNSRPKNISDEMYNYAESVIRAADAYMDNQLSYEEAYQKIDSLGDSAEKISDEHENDPNNTGDRLTYLDIGLVRSGLYLEHSGIETYADLLESRNMLAKQIGYSERD